MPSSLLAGLTEPQAQAAAHVDGPMLVLAGPGSGKTRVITHRIAHLVREVGLAPWNVLAITFTNKAASEMRSRIAGLVTERQARALTVATFHSLCARILRQHGEKLGLPPGYSIYDTSDQKRVIKEALDQLQINAKNFNPGALLGAISDAKQQLLSAAAFARDAHDFYNRTVAQVYQRYTEILTRNHALDFDDLLLKTVQLFREHPDALAQLREQYQYILIDEYQDTNHAQFMLCAALGQHGNVMVVGDPDQSIYAWRGADIRNIIDFEAHFPGAKLVRLEQNYRSTKTILAAADALIRNNGQRRHKQLWTENPEGEKIQVVTCLDERDEAEHLTRHLQNLQRDENVNWGQMAIFYRINSLSRVLEETLLRAGIPYQIARGTAFYERKEIKDALGYLRLVANPADEVTLQRVINNPPRGISPKTVQTLQATALADGLPIDRLLESPMLAPALASRAQASVEKFGVLLRSWREAAGLVAPLRESQSAPLLGDHGHEPALHELVEKILRESGLEEQLRNDRTDPDHERLANLGELISSARQFEQEWISGLMSDLEAAEEDLLAEEAPADAPPLQMPSLSEKLLGFLERVALVADLDGVSADQGAVTLMTLHAAKGLEFPFVAMVGVEEGLLPHERAQKDEQELEEERRLCFVGITRAEERLWISHAKYRTIFGQRMPTIASRFLRELPRETLQHDDRTEDPFPVEDAPRHGGSAQSGAASLYPVGCWVRHAQFGLGQVLGTHAMGAHSRIKVRFTTAGTKTLVLQYARLERIEPQKPAGERYHFEPDEDSAADTDDHD